MNKASGNKVIIFDTTLRDGEQSPGASLNIREKLQIAKELEKLKVDVIEAGFPYSSKGDFQAVQEISQTVKNSTVCALARAKESDLESAGKAIEKAKTKRIHTFIGASKIHLEHKLKITPQECLKRTIHAIKFASSFTQDLEFSAEDACRSDPEFLFELIQAAIEAGAKTINIPDTVGYTTPFELAELIKSIKSKVKSINQAVISVHCHNDLGLAVANSLAALVSGARQVECTINGIGERAGNCSLEEIVMILKTRHKLFDLETQIDAKQIARTSRLVSNLTGFFVQKNKAIVGANAFTHESGIHQDGVLKYKETYEIINPEEVGFTTNLISLGPRSGKHALKEKLKELGYKLEERELTRVYSDFKELADKKKQVSEGDLITLIDKEEQKITQEERFKLESLQIACGSGLPTASVEIFDLQKSQKLKGSALGTGPVDAVYQVIRQLTELSDNLIEFSVQSVTEGINAQGKVTIRIKYQNRVYTGHAADTDILLASAKAYISGVNKVFYFLNNY